MRRMISACGAGVNYRAASIPKQHPACLFVIDRMPAIGIDMRRERRNTAADPIVEAVEPELLLHAREEDARGLSWDDETVARVPELRLLREPLIDPEPTWKPTLYLLVAAVVIGCFVYATQSFWVPAHPGVDQNGYLVGGKMLA